MSANHSKISIIIPTIGKWDLLVEALDSIFAQTYDNWEAIIVNDGGPKPCGKICKYLINQPKVKYFEFSKNEGRSSARNHGIANSTGIYIAYLDDDDLFYPDHLETLIREIEKTSCGVIYSIATRGVYICENNVNKQLDKAVRFNEKYCQRSLFKRNYIPSQCLMHRKDLLSQTGNFDPQLSLMEDWELFLRLSLKTNFYHVDKITSEYRVFLDPITRKEKMLPAEEWTATFFYIYNKHAQAITLYANNPNGEKCLKYAISLFCIKNLSWLINKIKSDANAATYKDFLKKAYFFVRIFVFVMYLPILISSKISRAQL